MTATIIIVEGVDLAGKTTLINRLSKDLNATVIKNRLPTGREDVTAWVRLVQTVEDGFVICDRSPAISDPIYAPIARRALPIVTQSEGLSILQSLRSNHKLHVIHCDPGYAAILNNLKLDPVQPGWVTNNLTKLYRAYQEYPWGELPTYIYDYQLKDSYGFLVNYLKGTGPDEWLPVADETYADYEMSEVLAFHRKFEIPFPDQLALMPPDVFEYRMKFMHEELQEFYESHADRDMVKAFDALLDLTYVLKGTALMVGITPEQWNWGFQAVQHANMSKIRTPSASQSKRGHSFDVIKPLGWVGPEKTLRNILGVD